MNAKTIEADKPKISMPDLIQFKLGRLSKKGLQEKYDLNDRQEIILNPYLTKTNQKKVDELVHTLRITNYTPLADKILIKIYYTHLGLRDKPTLREQFISDVKQLYHQSYQQKKLSKLQTEESDNIWHLLNNISKFLNKLNAKGKNSTKIDRAEKFKILKEFESEIGKIIQKSSKAKKKLRDFGAKLDTKNRYEKKLQEPQFFHTNDGKQLIKTETPISKAKRKGLHKLESIEEDLIRLHSTKQFIFLLDFLISGNFEEIDKTYYLNCLKVFRNILLSAYTKKDKLIIINRYTSAIETSLKYLKRKPNKKLINNLFNLINLSLKTRRTAEQRTVLKLLNKAKTMYENSKIYSCQTTLAEANQEINKRLFSEKSINVKVGFRHKIIKNALSLQRKYQNIQTQIKFLENLQSNELFNAFQDSKLLSTIKTDKIINELKNLFDKIEKKSKKLENNTHYVMIDTSKENQEYYEENVIILEYILKKLIQKKHYDHVVRPMVNNLPTITDIMKIAFYFKRAQELAEHPNIKKLNKITVLNKLKQNLADNNLMEKNLFESLQKISELLKNDNVLEETKIMLSKLRFALEKINEYYFYKNYSKNFLKLDHAIQAIALRYERILGAISLLRFPEFRD